MGPTAVPAAPAIPVIVVVAATMILAVTDLWKFRVYNAVTLPLMLSGLVFNAAAPQGAGLGTSLLGALFGFGVLLVLYIMGGMGAGDVKLMAGIGAWLGMPLTFYVFIASSLAAGLYSVILLTLGRNLSETWTNFQILWLRLGAIGRHLGAANRVEQELVRSDRRHRLIPFAAMIIVGLVVVLIIFREQAVP
jgi:prepilin peptidase CpaA